MRILYHFPLCPFSRKVRILLAEKGLEHELVSEHFWERRRAFARLNPAMQVPVLVEMDGRTLPDSTAIVEYLEETYPPENHYLGATPEERAETRRLIAWFDIKCFQEVTRYLIQEKVVRYYQGVGYPSSEVIRAAKANLMPHLEYIAYQTRQQQWLAGERFSLADIAAAAQLSVLDYMGEVPWDAAPATRDWYALVKSRPSFRPLLKDRIPGFTPPLHYANPDF
jgi:glutathione S-transferase